MRRIAYAVALVIVMVGPATSQDQPKTVKTLRVESTRQPLYRVDDTGAVHIDWPSIISPLTSPQLP